MASSVSMAHFFNMLKSINFLKYVHSAVTGLPHRVREGRLGLDHLHRDSANTKVQQTIGMRVC